MWRSQLRRWTSVLRFDGSRTASTVKTRSRVGAGPTSRSHGRTTKPVPPALVRQKQKLRQVLKTKVKPAQERPAGPSSHSGILRKGPKEMITLSKWIDFCQREASLMEEYVGPGGFKTAMDTWKDRPVDKEIAAAILTAAFRRIRCLHLGQLKRDLTRQENLEFQSSLHRLGFLKAKKFFQSDLMHNAMMHWITLMPNKIFATRFTKLIEADKGANTIEFPSADLILEARSYARYKFLASLPTSFVTPDIEGHPVILWDAAAQIYFSDYTKDASDTSSYMPTTHPGRGKVSLSVRAKALATELAQRIRQCVEERDLHVRPDRQFQWYLPVPAERRLRSALITTGKIKPPENGPETSSMALTRLERPKDSPPVPRLAHGLDRVLFNPSVHWLQDPSSAVFNYSPQIQSIPPLKSFNFEGLTPFTPSSQDQTLRQVARDRKKKFTGSTSSLTFLLAHIYYLISRKQSPDISFLSFAFNGARRGRTAGMQAPGSIRINYQEETETYAFDSIKGPDAEDKFGLDKINVLSWMGTMLEKFLTLRPKIFNTLLKQASGNINEADRAQVPNEEAYQYSTSRNFVMRSQLDCIDSRLPGTGVFDIKTRATLAVRHDRLNVPNASAYTIVKQHGLFESFEREMYDLLRAAMIKYNFQARIGNMAGIFLAYHNTAKMLGFQYLSVEEMDKMLFGSHLAGNRVFDRCVSILDMLAEVIVKDFPRQTTDITFLGRGSNLRIWIPYTSQGPKGRPRPQILEYTLTVINHVNGKEVAGTPPLSDPDAKWDVKYKLCRAIGRRTPDDPIFTRFKNARKQQEWINKFVLPPGVSSDAEVQAVWEDIDLSLPSGSASRRRIMSQKDIKQLRRHFMPPYPLLLQARELADARRKGESPSTGAE